MSNQIFDKKSTKNVNDIDSDLLSMNTLGDLWLTMKQSARLWDFINDSHSNHKHIDTLGMRVNTGTNVNLPTWYKKLFGQLPIT